MKITKIGFVGFGRHAQANILPSIKALGYSICAISTKHVESAKKGSIEYSIPSYYSDYKEMFKQEKLDCVIVCSKPDTQQQIVKDALKSGLHVFVEKPLGLNTKEAMEIEELSKKHGKFVMVGFMKRFAPIYTKAHELLSSTKLGKVLSITQYMGSRNFTNNPYDYLLFGAIHFVDLLRFFAGEVKEARGYHTTRDNNISQTYSLLFNNGALGSINYSASKSLERGMQEIFINCEKGYIKTVGIDNLVYSINDVVTDNPRWQNIFEIETKFSSMLTTGGGGLQNLYLNGFIGEIESFLKCVQTNQIPTNNSSENLKTLALCEKMYKSFK